MFRKRPESYETHTKAYARTWKSGFAAIVTSGRLFPTTAKIFVSKRCGLDLSSYNDAEQKIQRCGTEMVFTIRQARRQMRCKQVPT